MAKPEGGHLIQPENDTSKVWRYMPFENFEWMLRNKSLFIPSAKLLANVDPYEGSLPLAWQRSLQRSAEQANDVAEVKDQKFSDTRDIMNIAIDDLMNAYVSCWHLHEGESTAMWQIYGKTKASVAIATEYKLLQTVFDDLFSIGMVRYIDHKEFNEGGKLKEVHLLSLKRDEFEHEKEVRAILPARELSKAGVDVRAGTKETGNGLIYPLLNFDFIRRVVVHPEAEGHVFDLVADTSTTHRLPAAERSKIADPPSRYLIKD